MAKASKKVKLSWAIVWPAVLLVSVYVSFSLFNFWFSFPAIVQPAALIATLIFAYRSIKKRSAKPNLSVNDHGIKFFIPLLLLIGFMGAQGRFGALFLNTFSVQPFFVAEAPILNIKITPPDYANKPPLILADNAPFKGFKTNYRQTVLEGSQMTIEVGQNLRVPSLMINQGKSLFEQIDVTHFRAQFFIIGDETIKVHLGNDRRLEWKITVIPDDAPYVRFKILPQALPNRALNIHFLAGDDFAIKKVTFNYKKSNDESETFSSNLPFVEGYSNLDVLNILDLTESPLAGQLVTAWLKVEDAIGQTSDSRMIKLILPQKSFTNKIAQQIINIRKALLVGKTPPEVAREQIKALSENDILLKNNYTVYSALRSVYWRLNISPDGDLEPISHILWQAALKIERDQGGNFAVLQ